jgi:hypothetical protein
MSVFKSGVRVPPDYIATVPQRKICWSIKGSAGKEKQQIIEAHNTHKCHKKAVDPKVDFAEGTKQASRAEQESELESESELEQDAGLSRSLGRPRLPSLYRPRLSSSNDELKVAFSACCSCSNTDCVWPSGIIPPRWDRQLGTRW